MSPMFYHNKDYCEFKKGDHIVAGDDKIWGMTKEDKQTLKKKGLLGKPVKIYPPSDAFYWRYPVVKSFKWKRIGAIHQSWGCSYPEKGELMEETK